MRRMLATILVRNSRRPIYRPRVINRIPEPPIGFVRRSDPNFYFLSRKF
jgi:hypothetical protein